METHTLQSQSKLFICLTLYLTSLFAANTLGIKLMPFFLGTHLSVGVFSFPIVFIMTDIISEVYGKTVAKQFVIAGIVSILLFLIYSFLSVITPWAKEGLWVQDSYNQIFGLSARISIASLLAFAVAEYQDVLSFSFFKKYTGQKYFWLRSNVSNIYSQLLDTVIFMLVAFLGIYPVHTIILIIVPWWIFKVIMGFCYTPLSYLGMYLLRDKKQKSNYEN